MEATESTVSSVPTTSARFELGEEFLQITLGLLHNLKETGDYEGWWYLTDITTSSGLTISTEILEGVIHELEDLVGSPTIDHKQRSVNFMKGEI